jgi:hypothetical protein
MRESAVARVKTVSWPRWIGRRHAMYLTVRKYSGANELIDVLVQNESEVRRLIREIDGFHAYYLVKTEDGGISISVFADKRGAEESNRVAAEWIRTNAAGVSASPPEVSAGAVVIMA